MDDKRPVLKVNPNFDPKVNTDALGVAFWGLRQESSWWGRLLERLRFGRAARRGIIFVPPVDASSAQLVAPGGRVPPMTSRRLEFLSEDRLEEWTPPPLDPHDGYQEFLRTLPDLTVQQVLEANEAAQLVALVGIADPEQRAGFWGKIRLRWWWRRLRRRLGYTSRPRPHGRLQRTGADFHR